MQLTLESDYAVRIVDCLVENRVKMDAKTIAEQTNVTLRFALKILRKLVANDIVKSYKGSKGGYVLNREPKDISLLDVIETVEGRYSISRCLDGGVCSGATGTCKFKSDFGRISDMVREELSKVNFDFHKETKPE